MADVPHHEPEADRTSYYLDQLFMIGVCGAVAGVTISLWWSGALTMLVHPKFSLAVGAGGICLLAIVLIRAIVVWRSVDAPAENGQGHDNCGHDHGNGHENCGHDHSHGHGSSGQITTNPSPGGAAMSLALAPAAAPTHSHSHSHSHSHAHAGHSHSHGDGHEHGAAPWRYIVLLLPVVLYFLVLSNPAFSRERFPTPSNPLEHIQNFILTFRSILWEALPFIILGSLIAGILEEFLPQSVMTAIIPRNPFIAVAAGGLLGLIFPMCECGIIPIMRRLLRKGLPLSCCIAYLLAGPIINVIVLLSTMAAFSGMENVFVGGEPSYQMGSLWMTGFRAGLGYLVAVTTALIVEWQHRKHGDSLLTPLARPSQAAAVEETVREPRPWWQRISNVTETTLHDFVDITVFLILGALLSASVRLFLGPEEIAVLGANHAILAIGLMMCLAIVLCLCSEADAFVAASFVTLRPSAKLAFLVLGPMLDFKLYAMYTRIFRPRLIFTIYASVIIQVFAFSVGIHYFWDANAKYLINPQMRVDPLSEEEITTTGVKSAMILGMVGTPAPGAWQPALVGAIPANPHFISPFEAAPEVSFLRLENAAINPQLRAYYEGKLVMLKGRFFGNDQVFTLLRYKRNCCEADSIPLKAYMRVAPSSPEKINPNLYRNQWVEVIGRLHFEPDPRGGYETKVELTPTKEQPLDKLIKIIPMPANPFIE